MRGFDEASGKYKLQTGKDGSGVEISLDKESVSLHEAADAPAAEAPAAAPAPAPAVEEAASAPPVEPEAIVQQAGAEVEQEEEHI